MATPVFELKNLDYYFDNKKVLDNINIKINPVSFWPLLVQMAQGNQHY